MVSNGNVRKCLFFLSSLVMKSIGAFRYIFSAALLLLLLGASAQDSTPQAQDDKFNVFLLAIGTVFMCAMLGAAIVGAMLAALVTLLLLGLVALGVLSVSFTVGLYNRSIGAGFKTFLIIVFGAAGSILGIAIALLARAVFSLHSSTTVLTTVAGIGGLAGGIIIASSTYKLVQAALLFLHKRARLR